MQVKITERGWPGHYICVDRCMFRRNTLIEYGKHRIVVSSVGNMRNRDNGKSETIGHCRTYETMAFKAVLHTGYWDADVSQIVDFKSSWGIHKEKVEQMDDQLANAIHDKVVKELARKIKTW